MNREGKQSPLLETNSIPSNLETEPELFPSIAKSSTLSREGSVLAEVRRKFSSPIVSVYTRHSKGCPHRDPHFRGCECPKWIYCNDHGQKQRYSAGTRSWNLAEQQRHALEDRLDPVQVEWNRMKNVYRPEHLRIDQAVETFLADARARNLTARTLINYGAALRTHLLPWSESKRLYFLHELTTPLLTEWRCTWTDKPGTCIMRREVLSTFFNFCMRQDWLQRNPAHYLSPTRHRQKPTDWFTPAEFDQVLSAACLLQTSFKRRRAGMRQRRRLMPLLALLMYSTGLAIRDAVFLERHRLQENSLFLYRSKTGEPVYCLLEEELAAALRAIPIGSVSDASHFFWNGNGTVDSVLGSWSSDFRRVFKLAAIRNLDGALKHCHSHMLRDCYAINLLLAGVPIEEVSVLLGHSSIRTTERHYLPWVRARQQKLDRSIRKAHTKGGVMNVKAAKELLKAMNVVSARRISWNPHE